MTAHATQKETSGFGLSELARPHPEGMGRFTPGWTRVTIVALVVMAVGLVAYARQFTEGFVVTGLRDVGTRSGAPWGLYIAFDVYFVGVSFAGITMAALIRLFDLKNLKPVARMAEALTVIALLLAGFAILVDLGQPLRGIVNLFRYGRPQSPFFGTFTLVIAGYLFASLVYLYLDGRRDAAICARQPSKLSGFHRAWASGYRGTEAEDERHRRVMFILAIAIIPLLVIAHSTLGFVFGIQVGRPGWFSALQAPAFVILAGVSGIGLLIVLAAIVRRVNGEAELLDTDKVFAWLGRFLMVLIIVYLYFMVTEIITATYTGHETESQVTQALLTGRYAWLFWLSVAFLAVSLCVLIWQAVTSRWSVGLLVAIGIAVNLAAIGKRLLIVVPSLTSGTLLPYGDGGYAPSWVEYSIIMGLLAFGVVLLILFMKSFPIINLELEEQAHPGTVAGISGGAGTQIAEAESSGAEEVAEVGKGAPKDA